MRSIQISRRKRRLHFQSAQVRELFRYLDDVLLNERIPPGELSIVFLGKSGMCRLHEDFLMDPTHTDVMTFPGDVEEDLAGEICVSADYAQEHALQYGQTFAEELTLYLVHGWLHLAGFDDKKDEDRAEMRKAEARVMDAVRKGGKVPAFSWKSDK
jgi:probable rRNA maturation factor